MVLTEALLDEGMKIVTEHPDVLVQGTEYRIDLPNASRRKLRNRKWCSICIDKC